MYSFLETRCIPIQLIDIMQHLQFIIIVKEAQLKLTFCLKMYFHVLIIQGNIIKILDAFLRWTTGSAKSYLSIEITAFDNNLLKLTEALFFWFSAVLKNQSDLLTVRGRLSIEPCSDLGLYLTALLDQDGRMSGTEEQETFVVLGSNISESS